MESQPFTINLSSAGPIKHLMRRVIAEKKADGWRGQVSKESQNFDFKFFNYRDDSEIYSLLLDSDRQRIVNRYPCTNQISRKDSFERSMEMARKIHGTMLDNEIEFDFMPRTFIFPYQKQEFLRYKNSLKKGACFIAKPPGGSLGHNCFVFRDLNEIPAHLVNKVIVQRYVDDPFLLDGLKFDLRIYVVVTGINDGEVSAFIAEEGLARFCTEEYERPTKENFSRPFMHLTNYSINKNSPYFVDESSIKDIFEPNRGTKRTLTALYKQIEQEYRDPRVLVKIKDSIDYACAGALSMITNQIQLYANPTNPNQAETSFPGRIFQAYGFDLLIDSSLKAWLLEINDHPSLGIHYCQSEGGPCNHKNCPVSEVDLAAKVALLRDSTDLVKTYSPTEMQEIHYHGSLSKLFPSFVPELRQLHGSIRQLKEIFLRCTQGRVVMTNTEFENNFAYRPFIQKKCEFKRYDVSMMFAKVTGNQKLIDFEGFFDVLTALHLMARAKMGAEAAGQDIFEFLDVLG